MLLFKFKYCQNKRYSPFCGFYRGSGMLYYVFKLLFLLSCLVYGMVPFLNAILGTMLPMLSMAKQDNIKWVFSSGKSP